MFMVVNRKEDVVLPKFGKTWIASVLGEPTASVGFEGVGLEQLIDGRDLPGLFHLGE